MKLQYTFFLVLYTTLCHSQADTLFWDASKLLQANQEYQDGYHIFKKNGIKIKEFKLVNRKSSGVCRDYYNNGNLKLEYELLYYASKYFYTGAYCEYYESGKIKTDGVYAWSDSIECVNCYSADEQRIITKAWEHSQRVGEWQEFFENGQVKARGHYKGIHQVYITNFPKPVNGARFAPGEISEDYLKSNTWYYYNEAGQLIKEEVYFNGVLAGVTAYAY